MKLNNRSIWILLLPVQWLLFKALSYFPQQVEAYYARGLYPMLSRALRAATGWLPLPLGQLLFYTALVYLVWSTFRLVQRLRKPTETRWIHGKEFITLWLKNLSIIYLVFNMVWGINYSRQSLQQSLELPEEAYSQDVLEGLCKELIAKTNALRPKRVNWQEPGTTNKVLFEGAVASYQRTQEEYPILAYQTPSVKAVWVPQVMSFAGIGGIYFPFTGEANVNTHPPLFKLPFTTCHEMAHQIGFASETEANFVAYLVCRNASDSLFRYSCHYTAMRYAMSALYRSNTAAYRALTKTYSPALQEDLALNRAYWKQFESPLEEISHTVNNAFLKANGQKEGIRSYGKMVDLLLADYVQRNKLVP